MSDLAELEIAVRGTAAFDAIDRHYLHSAVRSDDYATVGGRERIRELAIIELAEAGLEAPRIVHDLDAMIVFKFDGWRGHRWVVRDGARIIRETVVIDGMARARALGRDPGHEAARLGALRAEHAPLGELRAGLGQLAPGGKAVVPHDFPAAAVPYADALHRCWNGRALGSDAARRWRGPDGREGDGASAAVWMTELFAALPDAVVLFERAVVSGGTVALLWRLHGHHLGDGFGVTASGKRVRCQGSSVLTCDANGGIVAEDALVDTLAMIAQLHRQPIDYSI